LGKNPDLQLFPVARTDTNPFQICDLCDRNAVLELLRSVRPSRIFHCAGSFTNQYDQDYRGNVLTTLHLLEALWKLKHSCRILLIGSAAEYGIPQTETGFISENHALEPVSIYGLTKVFQTQLMDYFRRTRRMDIVMARIFNLDGDGISPLLFAGHVRSQINDYLAKKANKIEVGSLAAYRDYLPVGQAISGLISVMEKGTSGETYNIGSGRPILMKDYLNSLLKQHEIPMDAVHVDQGRQTKSSPVSVVAADVSKLQSLEASTRLE
jgi:GDP-4-dehydro-6-deoxy-D-mannose reductase